MYLTKITFGPQGSLKKKDFHFLADMYLDSLRDTGQIGASLSLNWVEGVLTAYVDVGRPDALNEEFHSEWGKKRLTEIIEKTGKAPEWTVIDDDVPKRFPRWQNASFLVLFANYWDDSGFSLRRGRDGYPIPQYLLPLEPYLKQNLNCWQNYYDCLMGVWVRGHGDIENAAYKGMADPSSDLSEQGRDLCREVEKGTNIPTYYFLYRYYGRRKGDENRRCPSCGGDWKLAKSFTSKTQGWQIDFLCKKCRLVSELARTDSDERHARIGEFNKK